MTEQQAYGPLEHKTTPGASYSMLATALLGMFAFATSGALLAIRKDFDAIGILLLAGLTATGGGVMRDLIIGATPPAAFTNLWYLVVPVVAAIVTFFAHPVLERLMTPVLIFDVAGLGLFCVAGTLTGTRPRAGSTQAPHWGDVTAGIGGRVLRDIVALRDPGARTPGS